MTLQRIAERTHFGKSQILDIASITQRQLQYWTEQGYLPDATVEGRNNEYTIAHVYTAYLIKQGLDAGLSLQKAVNAAQRHLEAHQDCLAESPVVIVEKLVALDEHISVEKTLSLVLKRVTLLSDEAQRIRMELAPLQLRRR